MRDVFLAFFGEGLLPPYTTRNNYDQSPVWSIPLRDRESPEAARNQPLDEGKGDSLKERSLREVHNRASVVASRQSTKPDA